MLLLHGADTWKYGKEIRLTVQLSNNKHFCGLTLNEIEKKCSATSENYLFISRFAFFVLSLARNFWPQLDCKYESFNFLESV